MISQRMQLIDDVGGEAGGPTIQDQFFRPELSEAGSFLSNSSGDCEFIHTGMIPERTHDSGMKKWRT